MSNKQFAIIIRGIQGSGKSTIARVLKQMMNDVNPVIVETDDYMVDENGRYLFDVKKIPVCVNKSAERVAEVLSQGGAVIASSTLVRANGVFERLDKIKEFKVPYLVLATTDEFQNQHDIPQHVVEAAKKKWEPFEGEVLINSKTSVEELKEIFQTHLGYTLFNTEL